MLRRLVILAFIFMSVAAAVAEPEKQSANYWLPFCRQVAAGNFYQGDAFTNGGRAEIIAGLMFLGQFVGVCGPESATPEQAARVVVQYLDQRPARTNENFKDLAVEAMRDAWPCNR